MFAFLSHHYDLIMTLISCCNSALAVEVLRQIGHLGGVYLVWLSNSIKHVLYIYYYGNLTVIVVHEMHG